MAALPLVRSSERGAFKNCPKSWEWGYLRGLKPAAIKHDARLIGTCWHLAMAEYYIPEPTLNPNKPLPTIEERRGRPLEDTINEFMRQMQNEYTKTQQARKNFDKEAFEEDWEMLLFLAEEYMLKYKGDPQWQVLAREETFAVNVLNKARAIGTIDLVVRDLETGYVWEVDHKTAKGFPNESSYNLDDQGGSYSAVGTVALRAKRLIGSKERVRGIIFSAVRKAKEDTRPQNEKGEYLNKNGTVSKSQPAPYFKRFEIRRTPTQQGKQLQRMVNDVTVMDAVRNGVIPVLKAPGKLCPYCDFFQLCQLDESGGDTEGMIEAMFKEQDPYHDHREGAENSKLSVNADRKLKME